MNLSDIDTRAAGEVQPPPCDECGAPAQRMLPEANLCERCASGETRYATLRFTEREFATLQAALVVYVRDIGEYGPHVDVIASGDGDFEPMDSPEVFALAERLNNTILYRRGEGEQ